MADRAYRLSVGIVGGATTALGVVLMPLPGPGTVVVLGGLTILATEFEGAGRVKDVGLRLAKDTVEKVKTWRTGRSY